MHILIVCTMTVQHLTKTDVHALTAFPDVVRMLQTHALLFSRRSYKSWRKRLIPACDFAIHS